MDLARLRATYFLAFASMGCFLPFVALYLRRRGVPAEQIAWMLAVVPLVRVAMPPLWGWVADRLGSPARVLRGLALAASLVSLGFPLAGSEPGLLAALIAQGLFHASLFPMLDATGLSLLAEQGGDYGEVRSAGSLGFLVGVLVGGTAWQGPRLLAAPLGLGLGSLGVYAAARGLPDRPAPDQPALRLDHVVRLLRVPGLAAVYLVSLLHELVICGYDLYFAVHCEALGLSTGVTGAAWAAGVGAEVLLLRRGASLLGSLGPRGLMLAGIGLGGVRWLLVAVTTDPRLLVPLQVLHAFSFGAWFLGAITLVDRLAPRPLRATAQGVFYAALFGLGASLGAHLWGHLLATRGGAAVFRFMGLAELVPLAVGLALLPTTAPPRREDATGSAP